MTAILINKKLFELFPDNIRDNREIVNIALNSKLTNL